LEEYGVTRGGVKLKLLGPNQVPPLPRLRAGGNYELESLAIFWATSRKVTSMTYTSRNACAVLQVPDHLIREAEVTSIPIDSSSLPMSVSPFVSWRIASWGWFAQQIPIISRHLTWNCGDFDAI
jgi:hypothetical protein